MQLSNNDLAHMMEAGAWEDARGALRKLVAIVGAKPADHGEGTKRYERLSERVNTFIREMEDEELVGA